MCLEVHSSLTLALTLGSWSLIRQQLMWTVPKAESSKHIWAETWGLSLQPLSIVLAPRQPGFRKRKLFPSFSFQAVCSLDDQDCHIKVYEKLFHWNSGTTILHGLLINGGSYVLFHAFHQVAWAEWGSPTMPWGPLCRFTFLSLWLFGVPSQSWQNRGMFINNQDTPLGWAGVLVCWMRLPSDVINLLLLLLLFSHSVTSSSLLPYRL